MSPTVVVARMLVAALAVMMIGGCHHEDGATAIDSIEIVQAAKPHVAADTELVRSLGVANDRDDTLGIAYGKREVPRPVRAPQCAPPGIALCLTDTARVGDAPDCCIAPQRTAAWLVFATPRDSMQFFVVSSRDEYLQMSPAAVGGFFAEHTRGVDGSWLRVRFPALGTYVYGVSIESDTSIAYELRVAPVLATGASRPTGAAATVTIPGKKTERVVIAPSSLAASLDSAALTKFAVAPGKYHVLLVRDTSYVACRLPCKERHAFVLHTDESITVEP